MLVTARRKDPKFEPIELCISLESAEEALAFHDLFNVATLTHVMERHSIDHGAIRLQITKSLGTTSGRLGTGSAYSEFVSRTH